MREGLIHSIQKQVEIDEPEAVAAPMLPQGHAPFSAEMIEFKMQRSTR